MWHPICNIIELSGEKEFRLKKEKEERLKEREKIKELLLTLKYDFLRDNEHLGDNIVLLALGGSHAYGMNTPESDIDLRGIALNRESDLLGFTNFESYRNEETDTCIYSFNKMVELLMGANPNIIEILGCREEDYLYISPIGQLLLDNKELFISQRVGNSFGGFALAQLRKLENALSRNEIPQTLKEVHILNSIKRYQMTWEEQFKAFDENSKFELNVGESTKADIDSEIFADVNLTQYPLRDFKAMIEGMTNIIRDYDKLEHRNNKRDESKINKHAAHLVRLYLMGSEILRTGEINTYRENDHDLLMDIRNGKYMNDDGTYSDEFSKLINELEADFQQAKKESTLPKEPKRKEIEKLVISINKQTIK